MNTTSSTAPIGTRIAAFFAATAVTTVLVGSQFGLAGHYNAEGGAVLAGAATGGVAVATVQRTAG